MSVNTIRYGELPITTIQLNEVKFPCVVGRDDTGVAVFCPPVMSQLNLDHTCNFDHFQVAVGELEIDAYVAPNDYWVSALKNEPFNATVPLTIKIVAMAALLDSGRSEKEAAQCAPVIRGGTFHREGRFVFFGTEA